MLTGLRKMWQLKLAALVTAVDFYKNTDNNITLITALSVKISQVCFNLMHDLFENNVITSFKKKRKKKKKIKVVALRSKP